MCPRAEDSPPHYARHCASRKPSQQNFEVRSALLQQGIEVHRGMNLPEARQPGSGEVRILTQSPHSQPRTALSPHLTVVSLYMGHRAEPRLRKGWGRRVSLAMVPPPGSRTGEKALQQGDGENMGAPGSELGSPATCLPGTPAVPGPDGPAPGSLSLPSRASGPRLGSGQVVFPSQPQPQRPE